MTKPELLRGAARRGSPGITAGARVVSASVDAAIATAQDVLVPILR
jgi:hypothetical protein